MTKDEKFYFNNLRCTGASGTAPVLSIAEEIYGRVTLDSEKGILDEYK